MNNNTPRNTPQRALSWKDLKKITIEQMLCLYVPDFTTDPEIVARAADKTLDGLVPIVPVVFIGSN